MDISQKQILIETKKLNKQFSNKFIVNSVINDLDINIYRNDFTVIMGKSRSGKSTLLYCLSGMDSVTRGNIILNNKDITLLSQDKLVKLRRKHLGFVFQQMNLMTNLSILENVTLPGYLIHKNKNIKEKGMEMLARVGISDLAYRMPHQVSGGQQQRAAIARALINEPDILFCDEPTGSLNSSSSEAVMDILLDCNENNHSILMVTHDVKTALRADRIIYIDDGSVKGEIYLEKYRKDKNLNDRNDMVQKWLEEMEW